MHKPSPQKSTKRSLPLERLEEVFKWVRHVPISPVNPQNSRRKPLESEVLNRGLKCEFAAGGARIAGHAGGLAVVIDGCVEPISDTPLTKCVATVGESTRWNQPSTNLGVRWMDGGRTYRATAYLPSIHRSWCKDVSVLRGVRCFFATCCFAKLGQGYSVLPDLCRVRSTYLF